MLLLPSSISSEETANPSLSSRELGPFVAMIKFLLLFSPFKKTST